jgi:hypothetical protein
MAGDLGTALNVVPDLDAYPFEIPPGRLAGAGRVTDIGILAAGTNTGRASIALVVTLPDGTKVIGETTWALLGAAHRALAASPIGQAQPEPL